MNRARWEIGVGGADGESAVEQIVRRNVVRDIDDRYVRIDFENDALQCAHQMIVGSVVRGEGDDWVRQWILRARVISAKVRRRSGKPPRTPFTLTNAHPAVKKRTQACCAIANAMGPQTLMP